MSLLSIDTEEVVLPHASQVLNEPGAQEMHLDLAGVQFLTAEGLRAVIHLHKAMRNRGGRLVLSNLTDEVHEVFEATGLVKVLDVRRQSTSSAER